jgi:hypothetical protein
MCDEPSRYTARARLAYVRLGTPAPRRRQVRAPTPVRGHLGCPHTWRPRPRPRTGVDDRTHPFSRAERRDPAPEKGPFEPRQLHDRVQRSERLVAFELETDQRRCHPGGLGNRAHSVADPRSSGGAAAIRRVPPGGAARVAPRGELPVLKIQEDHLDASSSHCLGGRAIDLVPACDRAAQLFEQQLLATELLLLHHVEELPYPDRVAAARNTPLGEGRDAHRRDAAVAQPSDREPVRIQASNPASTSLPRSESSRSPPSQSPSPASSNTRGRTGHTAPSGAHPGDNPGVVGPRTEAGVAEDLRQEVRVGGQALDQEAADGRAGTVQRLLAIVAAHESLAISGS